MTPIPTKAQWKNWGLPSKASYIGCVVGVIGILLTVAFGLFPGLPTKQISTYITENKLSGNDINASAVLQDVSATDISVSVVNTQIQNGIDNPPTPHFQVYINNLTTPITDHAVIELGEDRTVRIRVQNVCHIAADNISISVYVPLKPNDIVSAGWTIQAPPVNPKTRQEVNGLLHLWSVAAGVVPEQGWFRTPLLSISKQSPHPQFTRRTLEELGFEFSGSAIQCPEDFVFHVLPVILSVNSSRSPDHRLNLFLSF